MEAGVDIGALLAVMMQGDALPALRWQLPSVEGAAMMIFIFNAPKVSPVIRHPRLMLI